MAGALDRSTSRGQLVPFVFGQATVAANQTDVQLVAAIGEAAQAVDGYVLPWECEVVAISYQLTAAASAGSLTIGASVGGTEDTDTTATVTTATSGSKRVPREKCRLTAGQVLGVEITTNAGWNGTTADLSVVVWALANVEGI